jgi:hypothetical protein
MVPVTWHKVDNPLKASIWISHLYDHNQVQLNQTDQCVSPFWPNQNTLSVVAEISRLTRRRWFAPILVDLWHNKKVNLVFSFSRNQRRGFWDTWQPLDAEKRWCSIGFKSKFFKSMKFVIERQSIPMVTSSVDSR